MRRTGRERRRTERTGEPVQRITGAPAALADDISRRTHRYLVQMSIRVVCFIGAFAIDHWSRWLLLVGAVVLPYVAVLGANAGRERQPGPDTFVTPPALPGPPPERLGHT